MNAGKKKRAFGLLKIFFVLLFVFAIIVMILSLPFWRLKEVIVEGNSVVPSEKIKSAANISLDDNIFFVNSKEVGRRLKEIPQIKNVNVFPKIPSSIFIKVEERIPFAVFISGGKYYIVDDEGVIIDLAEKGGEKALITQGISNLPVVAGLPGKAVIGNKRIEKSFVLAVEKTFRLLQKLLATSRFQIEMKDKDDISILVNDILKVKIGDIENIDEKLKAFETIYNSVSGKGKQIEYIDVRLIDNPVVKFGK